MIKDVNTLLEAKRLAMSDPKLLDALKEWHSNKGRVVLQAQDYDFGDWLEWMLGDMSDNVGIDYPAFPTPRQMVEALRVNAVGDPLALACEDGARWAGLESDADCYAEEGVVYSSVWIAGKAAEDVNEHAERIAALFRESGYAADVSVDEEDGKEVTVNASIDFSLYYAKIS